MHRIFFSVIIEAQTQTFFLVIPIEVVLIVLDRDLHYSFVAFIDTEQLL